VPGKWLQLLSEWGIAVLLQSSVTNSTWGSSLFGLNFDRTIDMGAFLTFLTLVLGFIGWIYKTYREWRRTELQQAKGGALRLLLRILRDHDSPVISLPELRQRFEAPQMRDKRKAYCGRDFKFKNEPEFEAAVYQLSWEGKIDFWSPKEIALRIDDRSYRRPRVLLPIKPGDVLDTMEASLKNPGTHTYDLERLAMLSIRVAPSETIELLRRHADQASDSAGRERILVSFANAADWQRSSS
jgi:hypothetical protein